MEYFPWIGTILLWRRNNCSNFKIKLFHLKFCLNVVKCSSVLKILSLEIQWCNRNLVWIVDLKTMDFFNLNLSLHQTLYTMQEAGLTIPGPEAVKEKKNRETNPKKWRSFCDGLSPGRACDLIISGLIAFFSKCDGLLSHEKRVITPIVT